MVCVKVVFLYYDVTALEVAISMLAFLWADLNMISIIWATGKSNSLYKFVWAKIVVLNWSFWSSYAFGHLGILANGKHCTLNLSNPSIPNSAADKNNENVSNPSLFGGNVSKNLLDGLNASTQECVKLNALVLMRKLCLYVVSDNRDSNYEHGSVRKHQCGLMVLLCKVTNTIGVIVVSFTWIHKMYQRCRKIAPLGKKASDGCVKADM